MSISDIYPIFFFFNDTATTEIYTLSLHDALPILMRPEISCSKKCRLERGKLPGDCQKRKGQARSMKAMRFQSPCLAGKRSEEHTSELQSPCNLVCRLLLEKKDERHPKMRRLT